MNSFPFLSVLLVIVLFNACKQNTTKVVEESEVSSQTLTSDTVIDGQPMIVTKKAPNAHVIYNNISGGHNYTFLTDQLFHYKATNTVGKEKKEQSYTGQWIDLEPDGTYKVGKGSKQTQTGRWDYSHEKKVLQLRPDNTKVKKSEWSVMHNEDMVVLVGTRTFNDNAIQIQLVRSDKFPD